MPEPFTLTILGVTYGFSQLCLAILATSAGVGTIYMLGSKAYHEIKEYILNKYNRYNSTRFRKQSKNSDEIRAFYNAIYCLSYFSKHRGVRHRTRIDLHKDTISICLGGLILSDKEPGLLSFGRKNTIIWFHDNGAKYIDENGEKKSTDEVVLYFNCKEDIDYFENIFMKQDFIKKLSNGDTKPKYLHYDGYDAPNVTQQ